MSDDPEAFTAPTPHEAPCPWCQHCDLAAEFGVHATTIHRVVSRERWRHVA